MSEASTLALVSGPMLGCKVDTAGVGDESLSGRVVLLPMSAWSGSNMLDMCGEASETEQSILSGLVHLPL